MTKPDKILDIGADFNCSKDYPGIPTFLVDKIVTNATDVEVTRYNDLFLMNVRTVITFDNKRKLNLWENYMQLVLSSEYSPKCRKKYYSNNFVDTESKLIKYRWLSLYAGCIAILGDKDCCHVLSENFIGIHTYKYSNRFGNSYNFDRFKYGYVSVLDAEEDIRKIIQIVNNPVVDFEFVSNIRRQASIRRIKTVNFIASKLRDIGFTDKTSTEGLKTVYSKILTEQTVNNDLQNYNDKNNYKYKITVSINISNLMQSNDIIVNINTTYSQCVINPFSLHDISSNMYCSTDISSDIPEEFKNFIKLCQLNYCTKNLEDLKSYLNIVAQMIQNLNQHCFGHMRLEYFGYPSKQKKNKILFPDFSSKQEITYKSEYEIEALQQDDIILQ